MTIAYQSNPRILVACPIFSLHSAAVIVYMREVSVLPVVPLPLPPFPQRPTVYLHAFLIRITRLVLLHIIPSFLWAPDISLSMISSPLPCKQGIGREGAVQVLASLETQAVCACTTPLVQFRTANRNCRRHTGPAGRPSRGRLARDD
jgi:hypothetical protein